jgi:hypothetical protein
MCKKGLEKSDATCEDVLLALLVLLLSKEFPQNVGILDIVGHWVDHGIMLPLLVNVKIIACRIAAVVDDGGPSHNAVLIANLRSNPIQILFVLVHLHHFSLPLVICYFLWCEGDFLKLLLLLHSTLVLLGIHKVLFVELSIQIIPIALSNVLEPPLLCLPPLLASLFLLLYSVLNVFVFEVISFIVELNVIFCNAGLVI